jgi:MraZ protein
MFVGKYEVRLDSKNRVIVPQKMREAREGGGPVWSELFLTFGTEGCICAYTPEGWSLLVEAMGAKKPIPDSGLRLLQRFLAGNAVRCECDGQGRIVIPVELREHAGLTRDVFWIGAVSRAEIWDKARWQTYQDENISQLGEKLDIAAQAGFAVPKANDPARNRPEQG